MEDDLSKELDLQIKGAEKPSIWQLIGVRFVMLPYTIGKVRIIDLLVEIGIYLNVTGRKNNYIFFSDLILLSSSNALLEFDHGALRLQGS